jgi:hypothetical protein
MLRNLIEGGLNKAAAADQFNITAKTTAKVFFVTGLLGADEHREFGARPESAHKIEGCGQ